MSTNDRLQWSFLEPSDIVLQRRDCLGQIAGLGPGARIDPSISTPGSIVGYSTQSATGSPLFGRPTYVALDFERGTQPLFSESHLISTRVHVAAVYDRGVRLADPVLSVYLKHLVNDRPCAARAEHRSLRSCVSESRGRSIAIFENGILIRPHQEPRTSMPTQGEMPIEDFYIGTCVKQRVGFSTAVTPINSALREGKHLLLSGPVSIL